MDPNKVGVGKKEDNKTILESFPLIPLQLMSNKNMVKYKKDTFLVYIRHSRVKRITQEIYLKRTIHFYFNNIFS